MKSDEKCKNRVGAGWVLLIAEKIGDQIGLQWKTVVQVARVLDGECTITETELTAATEAALAVKCSTKIGRIEFALERRSVGDRR